MTRITQLLLTLVILLYPLMLVAQSTDIDPAIEMVLNKESIRIVITDSGMGGLSVMNDIADKLSESGSYKNVELIFVNALFSAESGYNALQSREEKIEMFNRALTGMNRRYNPDLIFVACNTLSVLINGTDFNRHPDSPPIISIVDSGVDLIYDRLNQSRSSSVIVLGTETTIEEGSHKTALVDRGISKDRAVFKACPQLQAYIEQDPTGEETEMLILYYLTEALTELPDNKLEVNISLNCSHFGYSIKLWEKGLSEIAERPGKILNPNHIMGDFLITDTNRDRFSDPEISLLIVSKVKFVNSDVMINIFSTSPKMKQALIDHQLIPDIF